MASKFANASAKRIAAQNERAIRNLRAGMLISFTFSLFLRLVLRQQTFASVPSVLIFALTYFPTLFLYMFLVRAGTPRRDGFGELLTPGEDLNQVGLMEWSWDIVYITWACQVGSSAFGEWIWWLYLIIPLYAGFKIWNGFVSPLGLGRLSGGAGDENSANEPSSRRQEKLRKRQEKGDPRVRAIPRKS